MLRKGEWRPDYDPATFPYKDCETMTDIIEVLMGQMSPVIADMFNDTGRLIDDLWNQEALQKEWKADLPSEAELHNRITGDLEPDLDAMLCVCGDEYCYGDYDCEVMEGV